MNVARDDDAGFPGNTGNDAGNGSPEIRMPEMTIPSPRSEDGGRASRRTGRFSRERKRAKDTASTHQ